MDVKTIGETALTGWREKVADGVAGPASSRTPLDEEQVRALVGIGFLALSIVYVVSTIRKLVQDDG
jgi:hypothetical protein